MLTLAEFRTEVGDDNAYVGFVIDELRRKNYILNHIGFEEATAAGGGGGLVYTWLKVLAQSSAATRAIGGAYAADEATTTRETVNLVPLGGSFGLDRVFANISMRQAVQFQIEQKTKSALTAWNNLFLAGDSAKDATQFDGVLKQIAGTAQEITPTSPVVLNGVSTEGAAFAVLEQLDTLLSQLDTTDGAALLVNRKTKTLLQNVARLARYNHDATDEFGKTYQTYNGVPIVDMGEVTANVQVPAIVSGTTQTTDIVAVRLGEDGVHALRPTGASPVQVYLPNPQAANGAEQLKGGVELVTGVAVKTLLAAAVLHNVQVG